MLKYRNRIIHIIWLGLLITFALLGTQQTPFHADESTVIWMSKDYGYIFHQGDIDRIRYVEPSTYPEEQHLRLLNGTVARYLMGFAWTNGGYALEDINQQWHWGFNWDWNISNGHKPSDELLQLSRLPSAIMLSLSIVALFGIGWYMGGWPAAYIASIIYVLNPAVLVNGRRAMFEGSLLLFSTLLVLVTLWYARDKRWWQALLAGFVAGLAVASKHTALFVIIGVFLPLGIRAIFIAHNRKMLAQIIVAGLVCCGVFFLLNPVWWGEPLARISQVLEARSGLLATQIDIFGGYDNFADQTTGFWRQSFGVEPQYFEVTGWENYIGGEIRSYESSLFSGIYFSLVGGVILSVLFIMGAVHIIKRREQTDWIALGWGAVILLSAWLLTPIGWQRYYLLTYPVISIYAAMGLVALWERVRGHQRTQQLTQNE